ncbi:MAG: nicotinamide mononucleotide transporter, partial [Sinobacteraceae bacterium]|nr:nicotinamide mononucleotide transporter [Nevskiaceae bacterium]
MIAPLEVGANAANAVSIVLAARNSVHTWWTGIVGCLLFGLVFFASRLYADALLQLFFVGTSAAGWWNWLAGGRHGTALPVSHAASHSVFALLCAALVVAVGYGYILSRYTDAFAPFMDSLILTLSMTAQLLL